VEGRIVERLATKDVNVCSPEFITRFRREFYESLPESFHVSRKRDGVVYQVASGRYRGFMVEVGRHTPPDFRALPEFMARFQEFYGDPKALATDQLVRTTAAHHRLAWIHPSMTATDVSSASTPKSC
jgi:Fic family protein